MREAAVPRPYNLIAELTYRCPLRCAYCSNPLQLADFPERLATEDWARVFREAAELGVVHVGLTGGEPSTRRDLDGIVAAATEAGLYTHLVTAGLPLDEAGLGELRRAGLRSVQLSLQDDRPEPAERIAGARSFERKLALAAEVRALGLPLTLNVVLHRHNLARIPELVALARRLDAQRLELANTQYHGWALANRAALLPSAAQLREAGEAVGEARAQSPRPEILFVLADYYAERPKPCSGGWGRKQMVVTPDGRVLPCQGAAALPLDFGTVLESSLARCWREAPGMQAFRGEAWMSEPCRSCPKRSQDFGGCRCQAFAFTGDAALTDPACALSPHHERVLAARAEATREAPPFRYRSLLKGSEEAGAALSDSRGPGRAG